MRSQEGLRRVLRRLGYRVAAIDVCDERGDTVEHRLQGELELLGGHLPSVLQRPGADRIYQRREPVWIDHRAKRPAIGRAVPVGSKRFAAEEVRC